MQPPHLVSLEYFRGMGIGKMWFTVGAGAAGVVTAFEQTAWTRAACVVRNSRN